MKKKILLVALMVALFICVFAITVSAQSLSNFINVELTLNDGSEVEAYLTKGSTWSGYQGYSRVTIYADYTDTSKTISWSNVKVFDGRNSTIHTYDGTTLTDTGAYAQTLLGYQTETSSVTHFYYPQGSLIVADNSFALAKKWNLEYLYVPKSVKILGVGICNGDTNLTMVEFESGSELEEIRGSAFRDCTALTSINLQDTKLKTISGADGNQTNGNVFRNCASLTSIQLPQTVEYIGYNAFLASGLSGKVVVPNSVTHLGPGSFLATPIETLVIGDGPVTIGNNFVGSYSDWNITFENTYLKTVYIPSEATFTKATETWFKSTNQVTFYVIGKNCTTLINSLKSSTGSKYMTIGMAGDENANAYNGIIVEGYSPCIAFYNNEHSVSNCICSRCEKVIYCDNPEHNLKIDISYENYLSEGVKSSVCLDCDTSPLLTSAPALFTCLGFSTPTEYGKKGLALGFEVNEEALSEYKATGKTISFGAYVAGYENVKNDNVTDMYNYVKAIKADVTVEDTSYFAMKVTGFEKGGNDDTKLCLGAYVIEENGDVSYLQAGEAEDGCNFLYTTYNLAYANSSNK